jgi:hypothetical protein
VQGSHIAVTTSTCILCHFKGKESNTDTARCTLCHHIPSKVIQHETLTLNHADVGRFGMECTSCHARPEGSDGRVPRERCVTCHNKASALDKYDDTELMHQTHVTDHKVDCMNCHLELEHVGPPQIEKASSACSTCHLKGHGPQMNLYAGIGGRGVANIPDPMFLAGVRCEGCHLGGPTPFGHSSKRRPRPWADPAQPPGAQSRQPWTTRASTSRWSRAARGSTTSATPTRCSTARTRT